MAVPGLTLPRSPITGKMTDRSRYNSISERGRLSVASNYSMNTSMDLTYRDYFGPPNYTPFDESMIELDFIKVRTKSQIKKLNSLKIRYMEWFTRKCKSFLDGIKLTQILAAKIVPNDIQTMKDFKKIQDMSRRFPRNGTPRDSNPAKMDEFSMFWAEMLDLKEETDDLYEALCKYCEGVTRLRQPSIKVEIDRLKVILDEGFSEDFVFTDVKNERDNLFVYKVAPTDHQYHGIMGYIPYLLTVSKKLLAWVTKVHLEKE
ncbi:uncharacterized protein LOC123557140 isoform X1 [Mercenaria mercenaria]|uniref:uncharacterized protein LOC123557140 isoform X1 n=1 Tax=Mercenaria mercenaria TaxID=6596 RepID=UPI001E1D226C|nr:uncharacterized protein LOC123557140 isoform X1 [Mercenaria mercenaria]